MSSKVPDEEKVLIKRVQLLQDKDAYSRLVKMHQANVRAFLIRISGDRELAFDLAQDCFVRAFKNIQSYKFKSNLQSWLMKIAFNIYLQHRRTETRRFDIEQSKSLFRAEKTVSSDYENLDIERALTQLKPIERATLTLNFTFGYSHSEIATILDMPVGTVKSHIKNGQDKLKMILS